MKLLTSILPWLAVVAFIIGMAEGSRAGGWGLGFPIGAVLVGLFLVLKVMGHESAKYDEEQKQQVLALDRKGVPTEPK